MSIKTTPSNKFVGQVCQNTKSDLIEITEDKLENILTKYSKSLKKSNGWITPLSLFVTILVAVSTADVNKDFLSINKEIWTAIYYIGLVFCFVWTILNVIQAISNNQQAKIENVLKKIKNN